MKSKNYGFVHILVVLGFLAFVVIAIAILGFTKHGLGQGQTPATSSVPVAAQDKDTKAIENVSNSDEVGPIQKDLNNTNFSTLDQDVLGVKTAADKL